MALISSNETEILAANVHHLYRASVAAQQPSSESPMNREYQIRFTAGFLVLFTAAAITLAWINFRKESQFIAPYDGAVLVERGGKVIVDQVEPNGPAGRSGIKAGDRVIAVDGHPVSRTETVTRQMYQDGAWSKITYSLMRGSTALEATPILVPMERSSNDWLRLIALIYLGIGLYVLFRRWTIYTLRTDEPLLANPGADDRREAEKPSPAPVRSQSPRAPASQPQPSRRRRRRRR